MKIILSKIKEFIYAKPLWAVGIFSLIFFLLGGTLFFLLNKNYVQDFANRNKPEREKNLHYRFTSPLLDCSYEGGPFAIKADNLKEKIEKIISRNIQEGRARQVSVYFRDLNNGPTLGINENEMFTPASLLKVPLLIAYLKKAEQKPEILQEKIVYDHQKNIDIDQNIKPSMILEKGKEYAVEELLKRAIIYSDNTAANLLLEKIESNFLANVYMDLGLEIPTEQKTENYMTVKNYASFFRILYNASYLSRPMSEKALILLAESAYEKGLQAGVPENINLAHKFGERTFEGSFQLHDCGIIYHAKSPYILCLMSRGDSLDELAATISDISRNVYEEIDKF